MRGATVGDADRGGRVIPVRDVRIVLTPPHSAAQADVIETPDSLVLLAGGRWGKTESAIRKVTRAMVNRPSLYWWVGLSRKSASYKKAWRALYRIWADALSAASLDPRRYINRSDHEIRTPHGATLMFRTAENPQSIAESPAPRSRGHLHTSSRPDAVAFGAARALLTERHRCTWGRSES